MLDVYMPMMKSAAIVSAGRLGLFEALAEGPLSVPQLADKIQSSIKGTATLAEYKLLPKHDSDVLWNFEKFLVGRDGRIIHRFAPDVTPDDPLLVAAIEAALS